jgi:hypothetical protein
MNLKQGNTYKLKAVINNVDIDDISEIVFKFNDVEKIYKSDGSGDVTYADGTFTVLFSQEDTLNFSEIVYYEVGVKFNDNSVKRSNVQKTSVFKTIIERVI